MHSSHLHMSFKIQLWYKSGSYICNHSQAAHSCEVCDLPRTASSALTNEVQQGVIHLHDNATTQSAHRTGIH